MRVLKVMLCMSIFFSFSTFHVLAEENSNVKSGTKYEMYHKPLMWSLLATEKTEKLGKETGEELASFQYIKTKTNAPYEIALAHVNGDYSYVEQSNNLEAAIEKVNKMNVTDKSTQPVVVSKEGLVVYAEQSMGQVVKIKDGKIYPKDATVEVFREKDSSIKHMSVNHLFIDDVPVLVDRGTRARVEIAGYVGWVNKDPKASEQDLVVVPLNQAVNPSRYYVKDGKLVHYISRNIKVKGEGNEVTLGPAPSFMKEGIKYYSYDGMYFYTDLSTLINDTPDGEHKLSINVNNPYYNYYMYLPFRTETNYTAQELNNYIAANTPTTSKLRNTGAKLIELQGKYGVNALTILAVAMNESAKGTSKLAMERNNFFGIGAIDIDPNNAKKYETPQACLEDFAKTYISKGYSDPQDSRYQGGFLGNKYLGANVMYATDPYWGEKAAMYAYLADYSLRDFNFYQLASINRDTTIFDRNENNLYSLDIIPFFDYYVHGGPIASLVTNTPVNLGSSAYYEILPERHTPVSQGEFQGEYKWNSKGYVSSAIVTMINKGTLIDVKGVTNVQTTVTGKTQPNGIVRVTSNNIEIGKSTASDTGKFSVTIPKQKEGTKLVVYMTKGSTQSKKVTLKVTDGIAPAKPSVNAVFDKDTIVTGTAEANAMVYVKVGTSVKGSAKADAKGKYSVKIAPQKGGTTLTINAQDAAKNTSASQTVKVINTNITVKVAKVTDMKKYDGGKNQLTFINGKGYSQFFYENKSGNYQFVPSSWLKAAGLTVEVKVVNEKKFVFINNPYLSSTPSKVTAPPTLPNISVKTTAVTDMKKYDGGSNSLTFINGKAYSQFFYENKSGNYQFVPSSWLKAAGLTVEVKKTGSVKRLYISNPYKK